jgi:sphinganine C4-monooxygenase
LPLILGLFDCPTMSNATIAASLPPLPTYTLTPLPSIVPGISDQLLALLLPIAAYWILSIGFHILDVYDLGSQYRLHTPAEVLKRNHVTRYEVIKDVILQQIIQTVFGLVIGMTDPAEMTGKQSFEIAVWARRIRAAQRFMPTILAVGGINAVELGKKLAAMHPTTAGLVLGGQYPHLTQHISGANGLSDAVPGFALWEIWAAQLIYWALIPALQFAVAVFILDTWQYFLHRAMHMNQWLYTTLHARHHRLYVPYAFGALYNHPLEGFLLDTLGTGVAYLATGMTTRQGMWFFTCSTIKTVDDHCGYAFPWDPLQHITSNNAAYHDVHHQSWGVKTNFSQPFFTFWDRILGTVWSGGDVSARYERSRIAAQKKADKEQEAREASVVNTPQIDRQRAAEQATLSQRQVREDETYSGQEVIEEEQMEEREMRQQQGRSSRRKTGSFDPNGDGFWGLTGRMTNGLHGRSTAILHTDGRH